MKPFYILLPVFGLAGAPAFTQAADIVPPRQREILVESAAILLKEREAPVIVAEDVANPFLWPVEESVDAPIAESEAPTPTMDSSFFARMAASLPVTGTVNLGGEFILLLGQKRLKVGDSITISFEGQNYELTIADIASTAFTVTRGSLTHTRATHLSN